MATKSHKPKGKKKWFAIQAPKMFREIILGETTAYEPESIIGRTLTVNLFRLTNDLKKQNKAVTFRIKSVNGSTAVTEISGFKILPMHIKRYVRKDKDRIDDSFKIITKDKTNIMIKPLLITRAHTQKSVQTALRLSLREFFANKGKSKTFEELIKGIISGSLQSEAKSFLKKVYPVNVTEIKIIQKV